MTSRVVFADLPKDYAGLCGLLLPRPIRDKTDLQSVKEIAEAMAGFEDAFTKDQGDYFEMLCMLLEDFERN